MDGIDAGKMEYPDDAGRPGPRHRMQYFGHH